MAGTLEHILERVAVYSELPFMVYKESENDLTRYKGEKTEKVPVPAILKESLTNPEVKTAFFSKGADRVVMYLLRFSAEGEKYTVIISDSKSREKLNKFVSALAFCYSEAKDENEMLSKRIEDLGYRLTLAGMNATSAQSDTENAEKIFKKLSEEKERLAGSMEESRREINRLKEVIEGIEKTSEAAKARTSEYEEKIKTLEEDVREKAKKFDSLQFDMDEMTELVKVVKKSRDKLMSLVDGIFVPMYSVSKSRVLVHANKALAEYARAANVAKIIGKNCYEVVFGFDGPCPWCKLDHVASAGEYASFDVTVEKDGKTRNIELTTFPMVDNSGNITDCGEVLSDKTDAVEMALSLNKFKEQIKTFKRAKISDMNEIQDVKKAYNELSGNYDELAAKNAKMTKALESLMNQDSAREVAAARTETTEYSNKLKRASEAIKNYQRNVEELQAKYADLNKRTFFQMERFINAINSRYGVTEDELKAMIASVKKDFEEVKTYLMKKEENK